MSLGQEQKRTSLRLLLKWGGGGGGGGGKLDNFIGKDGIENREPLSKYETKF